MPPQEEEVSTPVVNNLEGQIQDTPVHPFRVESLSWKNISYYYKTSAAGKGSKSKQSEKAAVKQCTGVVKRGDMVAVMGKFVIS